MLAAGWVVGCSAGPAPSSAIPPMDGDSCVGANACNGSLTCSGADCTCVCEDSAPMEPVEKACKGFDLCSGTQRCGANGCSTCVCPKEKTAWGFDSPGTAIELQAGTDGSVVLRLDSAPWLVRYAADGQSTALQVAEALDWMQGFAVARDGSIFVAGNVSSAADADSTVKMTHLDASGALIKEMNWPEPTTFVRSMAASPDGHVYLGGGGRLANGLPEYRVVAVNDDGSPGAAVDSPVEPEVLAVDMNGHAVAGSVAAPSDFFTSQAVLLRPDQAATGLFLRDANARIPTNYFAGAAPDGEGGFYYGAAEEGANGFSVHLQRVDAAGKGSSAASAIVSVGEHAGLVGLSDSTLLALGRVPHGTSIRSQFSFDNYESLSTLVDSVAVGPLSAVIVVQRPSGKGYSIARVDFPAWD